GFAPNRRKGPLTGLPLGSARPERDDKTDSFYSPQNLTYQGLNPPRPQPSRASRFSRELRRSNTRPPNSSHDRCVMAGCTADGLPPPPNHWPTCRGSPYKAGEI